MNWKDRIRREFMETDRQFVDEVLPVGSVDRAAFGLLADATRYLLVEEAEEVHVRAEIAAAEEVLRSLAHSGLAVKPQDAQAAVDRFAAMWEEKARHRGTWEGAVNVARHSGEIETGPRHAPREPRRCLWTRLFGRRSSGSAG